MRREKRKGEAINRLLIWECVLLWTLITLFLSFQRGSDTGRLSMMLARPLGTWLHAHGYDIQLSVLHDYLRQAAHGLLFFLGGVLLTKGWLALLRGRAHSGRKALLAAFASSAVLSFGSEWVKKWIDGRHCQIDDAVLNMIGAAAGILLVSAIHWLRERCRRAAREKTA